MANFILPRSLFKPGTTYKNPYNKSWLKNRIDKQWWYKGVIPISKEVTPNFLYINIVYERLKGYTFDAFQEMFGDFWKKWGGGKEKEYFINHKQEFIDDCEKAYQKYIDYCDANGIKYYVKD